MKSMNDLVLHFLQDIYYAEKHSVKSMAKMARAVDNAELKQAILQHRDVSQTQVHRLEQVFEALEKRPRAKACEAMNGLVEETDDVIAEGEKGAVLDAAVIACAQAIEHYEIARYGALAAWVRTMGLDEAADLLQQTLDEEKEADAKLNAIALRTLNPQAAESEESDEEDGGEEDGDEEAAGEDSEDGESEMALEAEEDMEEEEVKETPPKRTRSRRIAPARKPDAKPAPAKKPARRGTRK